MGYHKPIMAKKCLELLNIGRGGVYVDCTAGGGGHSALILDELSGSGRLVAFDKDGDAIAHCQKRFCDSENMELIRSDFKNAPDILRERGICPDGIIIDLGISSHQINARNDEDRGFSYMSRDGALDMRMDRSQRLTAGEIVNEWDEARIFQIIRDFGEDRFAKNIAKNIVAFRQNEPIKTTGQLSDIIDKSIPFAVKKTGGHPAKRTFQALRIAVNGELDDLKETIVEFARMLKKGGRIVVLTFHSLEDRLVKQAFKYLETDCLCDKNAPLCVCGKKKEIRILAKPIVPDEKEVTDNPRAASAKLRAAERL